MKNNQYNSNTQDLIECLIINNGERQQLSAQRDQAAISQSLKSSPLQGGGHKKIDQCLWNLAWQCSENDSAVSPAIRKAEQNIVYQKLYSTNDKRMITVIKTSENQDKNEYTVFFKGAPNLIQDKITMFINTAGENVKFTVKDSKQNFKILTELESQNMRCIALAYSRIKLSKEIKLDNLREDELL